jgi:hypothetical protein
MILFTILFFLRVNVLGGETYTPAPPDKNKTLPANDGGPDGCNSSRFKCVMGGEAVLDKQTAHPPLPDGHPFKNVARVSPAGYWTGTTYEGNSNNAYYISTSYGAVRDELKLFDVRIWPVLGGN